MVVGQNTHLVSMQLWLLTKKCVTATFKPHYFKSIKQIRNFNHAMSSTDMVYICIYIYIMNKHGNYTYTIYHYISHNLDGPWSKPYASKIWVRMLSRHVATFSPLQLPRLAQSVCLPTAFFLTTRLASHPRRSTERQTKLPSGYLT